MKKLFFLALITLLSCNSAKWSFSDAANWIPGNFNPSNGVLLIGIYPGNEKSNEAMNEFLAEKYTGKYEVVDQQAILSKTGKYADTKKYQFAFLWKKNFTDRAEINSSFTYHNLDPNGYFYDRTNGREYPTTKMHNNYGNRSYIAFFNSIINYFEK